MSNPIKTMAHMVTNRAVDIETTRRIEQQKQDRLEAIREHCKTLRGDDLLVMQDHHPELFSDNEEE
jgi:adenosyl cobinamide kinase/adenosyl cobinamide phosphate guanylyltransferase